MPMTSDRTLAGGVDPTEDAEPTDPAKLAEQVGRPGHDRSQGPPLPTGPPTAHLTNPAEDLLDTTGRLLDRPGWHTTNPPTAVAKAWEKVKAAVERTDNVAVELAQLDVTYRRAEQAGEQAVLDAVRQGKRPPTMPSPHEHSQTKADLVARHRAAHILASETRTAYDAAVAEHLADWRASLIDGFDQLQPAAREAWARFGAALGAWRGRIATIDAMTGQLFPDALLPPRTGEGQRLLTQMGKGLAAVEALLGSNDPDTNGAWVTEDATLDPPMTLRRYWLGIGQAGWVQLAAVEKAEREEGKVVSTFLVDAEGNVLDPRTGRPTVAVAGT